jgi:PAS domain-containing protein
MPTVPPVADAAVIDLDPTGAYLGANESALELLGVSLAELVASSPDRFAMERRDPAEQGALRAEWALTGSWPMVGTTGIRRANGEVIRVSYAIEPIPSGFRASLSPVGGAAEAPQTYFTVGDVIREWRAAERKLSSLAAGSPDWASTMSEIELLRTRYQELFRSVTRSEDPSTT